jgi:hypothetical protein
MAMRAYADASISRRRRARRVSARLLIDGEAPQAGSDQVNFGGSVYDMRLSQGVADHAYASCRHADADDGGRARSEMPDAAARRVLCGVAGAWRAGRVLCVSGRRPCAAQGEGSRGFAQTERRPVSALVLRLLPRNRICGRAQTNAVASGEALKHSLYAWVGAKIKRVWDSDPGRILFIRTCS